MYRIGPIGRKSNFHSREKCLIGLVLVTLCFLCFGGIFLLPDNFGSERVLRVYKHFQKAGPEIFIPAPPLAAHAPRDEDPHFMGDRQRLQQKIIAELGDILEEPEAAGAVDTAAAAAGGANDAANANANGDALAQAPAPVAQQEQPVEQEQIAEPGAAPHHVSPDDTAIHSNNNNNNALPGGGQQLKLPMGMAAEHADPEVEKKRLKVKEVSSIRHAFFSHLQISCQLAGVASFPN